MNGPTDLGSAGGEGVGSGVDRVEPAASTPALNSPPPVLPMGSAGAAATASAGPYTEGEFAALVASIWSVDEDDPFLFDELLTAALAFIARVALDGARPGIEQSRARRLLRWMEQRAVWGPPTNPEDL